MPAFPGKAPRALPAPSQARLPRFRGGFAGQPFPRSRAARWLLAGFLCRQHFSCRPGSLIFRGYSVFKGQAARIPGPPASSPAYCTANGAFEFLLAGFCFFFPSPLKRGERYYTNSADFVKGFFQEIHAPPMAGDGAKTNGKLRENRKKTKKTAPAPACPVRVFENLSLPKKSSRLTSVLYPLAALADMLLKYEMAAKFNGAILLKSKF